MIITKSTSDSCLVNSLVVLNEASSPLIKLTAFNTATLQATRTSGIVTAASFFFVASSITTMAAIQQALPEDLHGYIKLSFSTDGVVYAMTQADTDPDYFLVLGEQVTARLATCGKCSEQFVVWMDGAGNVWSAGKTNGTDRHPKASKLTTIVCDACAEPLLLRR